MAAMSSTRSSATSAPTLRPSAICCAVCGTFTTTGVVRQRGLGRHVGRSRREVVDVDVLRPGEPLVLVVERVPFRDLRLGAGDEREQRDERCCNESLVLPHLHLLPLQCARAAQPNQSKPLAAIQLPATRTAIRAQSTRSATTSEEASAASANTAAASPTSAAATMPTSPARLPFRKPWWQTHERSESGDCPRRELHVEREQRAEREHPDRRHDVALGDGRRRCAQERTEQPRTRQNEQHAAALLGAAQAREQRERERAEEVAPDSSKKCTAPS